MMKVKRSEIAFTRHVDEGFEPLELANVVTKIEVRGPPGEYQWRHCGAEGFGFETDVDAAVDALETLGIEVE